MAFRYAYRCAQRLNDHGILGLTTLITAVSQNSTLLTAPWQAAAAVDIMPASESIHAVHALMCHAVTPIGGSVIRGLELP